MGLPYHSDQVLQCNYPSNFSLVREMRATAVFMVAHFLRITRKHVVRTAVYTHVTQRLGVSWGLHRQRPTPRDAMNLLFRLFIDSW